MNTFKLHALIILSFSASSSLMGLHPFSFMNEMRENMRKMEDEFEHMLSKSMEEMANLQQGIDLNLKEEKDGLLITAKNLDTASAEASTSENGENLLIKTSQGTINIDTQDNQLVLDLQFKSSSAKPFTKSSGLKANPNKGFAFTPEDSARDTEDRQEKENLEEDESLMSTSSYMQQRYGVTLAHPVNLENPKLTYDKSSKTLTVELAYIVEKKEDQNRKQHTINIR